tara:strand:+ start:159 stop:683 length:525 start_codon:yes stop_codon:yes gene_type:complete
MKATFKRLQKISSYPSLVSSDDIVEILETKAKLEGVKIAALVDLSDFCDVAHVVYLVKEQDKDRYGQQMGHSVCMIITNQGTVHLEMNTQLNWFWDHWRRVPALDFCEVGKAIDEIIYFFERQEPKCEYLYEFQDGLRNERFHRVMRSEQKVKDLKEAFGYEITASAYNSANTI